MAVSSIPEPNASIAEMSSWTLFVLFMVVVAHFGLRLAAYNRLNSLGWSRKMVKRLEKWMFAETWLTPVVILRCWQGMWADWLFGRMDWVGIPFGLRLYGLVCLVLGGVFGCLWLTWRPIWKVQHANVMRSVEVEDVAESSERALPCTRKCRIASRIPLNQIFELAIEKVDLHVPGLPSGLDGYRIAHLSDIHLTGQVRSDYIQRVMSHVSTWQPEMIALTGDIVDKQRCIDWLPSIFADASAPDGCYFVLGNHDTRVSDPSQVRAVMEAAGWRDLGGLVKNSQMRKTDVVLIGNEAPWFSRPDSSDLESCQQNPIEFRLCLSHSPDQYDWCRRHGVELMLAGHTHGGQGRLPLLGPILSPSRHGSRWASGDFCRPPTTLHVSRGLGGVHLLRINCRPELSLLTLHASAGALGKCHEG